MDIVSPLLTLTGKSVAKFLLKKYLASLETGQALAKDLLEAGEVAGEELVDIAATGIPTTLEQRRAARLFLQVAPAQVTPPAPVDEHRVLT